MYKINDIKKHKGHIITKDYKYYLLNDGRYDYWYEIREMSNNTIHVLHALTRVDLGLDYSYCYCFRNDLENAVKRLNELLD